MICASTVHTVMLAAKSRPYNILFFGGDVSFDRRVERPCLVTVSELVSTNAHLQREMHEATFLHSNKPDKHILLVATLHSGEELHIEYDAKDTFSTHDCQRKTHQVAQLPRRSHLFLQLLSRALSTGSLPCGIVLHGQMT